MQLHRQGSVWKDPFWRPAQGRCSARLKAQGDSAHKGMSAASLPATFPEYLHLKTAFHEGLCSDRSGLGNPLPGVSASLLFKAYQPQGVLNLSFCVYLVDYSPECCVLCLQAYAVGANFSGIAHLLGRPMRTHGLLAHV